MSDHTDGAYRRFILRVASYYGGKTLPSRHAIDVWVEEMEKAKIREDCLDRIFDVVKEGNTFPRNFPSAVKAAFRQVHGGDGVQYDNQRDERSCSVKGCSGGLLFLRKQCQLGYSSRYVFRCKACGRAGENGIPAAYLDDLERDGYRMEVSVYAERG